MKIVKMLMTGVSAILMHNPASMRQTDADEIQRGGKKIPLPLDEARSYLYSLPNKQLYIGSDCFREAGLIAAKSIRDPTRKGRASMTDRFGASVFLSGETCPLFRATGSHAPIMAEPEPDSLKDIAGEWSVFTKSVVIQKARIIRHRPKIEDWCCPIEFEYDDETIDQNLILAVMQQSGRFPGVLDYRVGTKGPFGRYKVEFGNGLDLNEASEKKTKTMKRRVK